MPAATILMLVQIATIIGPAAYDFISKLSGGKIPTYDQLMTLNDDVQAKIDSQKPK